MEENKGFWARFVEDNPKLTMVTICIVVVEIFDYLKGFQKKSK